MKNIIIKYANKDIDKELDLIGFDKSYIHIAAEKYKGNVYKIFNLRPFEANILKQLCLSLGFDCAVNRNTITCQCEYTDAVIFASNAQLKALTKKLYKQPFKLKELAFLIEDLQNKEIKPLIIRGYNFDWKKRSYIMGILNATPDSFSDGGKYNNTEAALKHCIQMAEDGADIIDIGGESTRPDAQLITPCEEIKRVVPVIEAIRKNNIDIPISIDTRNYETAKAAIDSGADIINDVTGFDYDKRLSEFVCEKNIPSIIMHSDKVPAVSENYTGKDIAEDIYLSLNSKIKNLTEQGLCKTNIIADTGIGFGKSQDACFEILKRHNEFKSLGVALLLGISRKSFIRNSFNLSIDNSDIPTALYSAIMSANKSVNIHRVHNVKQTKDFLNFAEKLF